jgi:ribosome-associated protein
VAHLRRSCKSRIYLPPPSRAGLLTNGPSDLAQDEPVPIVVVLHKFRFCATQSLDAKLAHLTLNFRFMIRLPDSDDELLRECEVETFRSSGPGGQHVNKTESAVRLRHLPSGVVVSSQQERSQHRNKALCLQKLRRKVAQLNYRAPRRIPTRLPAAAKKRTLEEKSRRSQIKRLRSKPSVEE